MRLLVDEPIKIGSEDRVPATWSLALSRAFENLGNERTIVIYITLAGAADSDGAYLIADGQGDLEGRRLRLEDLLDDLEQLPDRQNKLLILDCVRTESDWSLGVLSNNFARRLEELDDRIRAIPRLAVIASAGDGQRSWAEDSWGVTVFGGFTLLALAGEADGQGGPRDGRVDALELFTYVRDRVKTWSAEHFDADQTPMLLPSAGWGTDRVRQMELCATGLGTGDRSVLIQPPDPATPSRTVDESSQTQLRSRWEVWEQLRHPDDHRPAAPTVSPLLWARYQASLIRYEQLVRAAEGAGDQPYAAISDSIEMLGRELDRLQAQLASVGPIPISLATSCASLAMPEAFFEPLSATDSERLVLFELALDPEDAESEALEAVLKQARQDEEGHLQFIRFLAERAEAIALAGSVTPEQLNPIRVAARKLAMETKVPPPPELLLIAALSRDILQEGVEGPEQAKLSRALTLALEVRPLAERASLGLASEIGFDARYPDRVWPWIEGTIKQGDSRRRRAEDLLFSPRSSDWETAAEGLSEARQWYTNGIGEAAGAEAIASKVLQALVIRDRVLPLLPDYTRWVALQFAQYPEAKARDRWNSGRMTVLWDNASLLLSELDNVNEGSDVQKIVDLAEKLANHFRELQLDFFNECQRLLKVEEAGTAARIEAILAVPFLHDFGGAETASTVPPLRLQLLDRLKTLERVEGHTPNTKVHLENFEQDQVPFAKAPLLAFESQVSRDRSNTSRSDLKNEEEIHKSFSRSQLVAIGEQIAEAWWGRVDRIDRLVDQALEIGMATPERLEQAERWARMLDGPVAHRLLGRLQVEPSLIRRQRDYRNLLVAQAERVALDAWEDPEGPSPYFKQVAWSLLKEAESLGPTGPERDRINDLLVVLDPIDGQVPDLYMSLAGGYRIDLTSEPRREIIARPNWDSPGPDALAPSGLVIAEIHADIAEVQADGALLEPVGEDRGLPLAIGPDREDAEAITSTFRNIGLERIEANLRAGAEPERSAFSIRSYFRGRRQSNYVEMSLHSPTILIAEPRRSSPPTLNIQASDALLDRYGTGDGALAIVLDCSYSMHREGDPENVDSLFREVLEALEVLLRRVPRGTNVSVWMFGHALSQYEAVRPPERVLQVSSWPSGEQADTLIQNWLARLGSFRARGNSPIARTMLLAKLQHLDRAPRSGFKALVVITDGIDSAFDSDTQLNPEGRPVGDVLRERFDGSGIEVDVIGFQISEEQVGTARQQFGVVEELDLPGRFVLADDRLELADRLRIAFEQRLAYRVVDVLGDRLRGLGDDPLEVGTFGSPRWIEPGLTPGLHEVRLLAGQNNRRLVALEAGDRLQLELFDSSYGLLLRRSLMADEQDREGWRLDRAGWAAAVWRNQQLENGDLSMLATLEALNEPPDDAPLQVIWPEQTWIEVAKGPGENSLPRSWAAVEGYPAPAWSIVAPDWGSRTGTSIGETAPVLRFYWSERPEAGRVALVPCGDFEGLAIGSAQRLKLDHGQGDDSRTTLHAPTVEEHLVEVEPGVRRQVLCLVLRIDYGDGSPFWAKPIGLRTAGAEHRFYDVGSPNAPEGRYTGLFWPVTEAGAIDALTHLGIYSRDAFVEDCQARKLGPRVASFNNLGIPKSGGSPMAPAPALLSAIERPVDGSSSNFPTNPSPFARPALLPPVEATTSP